MRKSRPSLEFTALYERALPAKRSGPLYGAFPYPTKISPEAIALFIGAHTEPGDTIFDGFAGSGTTGLAALLCERPSAELRNEAQRMELDIEWGARNAVLYELGALGAFVAQTLTHPPEPSAFLHAAQQLLEQAQRDDGWMYAAEDAQGNPGTIRHVVWSDQLVCPSCGINVSLWRTCVSRAPAAIASVFTCPNCAHEEALDNTARAAEKKFDKLIGKEVEQRSRHPAWLYGVTNRRTWCRPVNNHDIELLQRIVDEPIPGTVPRIAIPWGDLHRRGYHQGISHLHHFYTRRNLVVFGRLWERIQDYDASLRDALRFWLLSYNASHATLMTRVVAKSGQKELVATSAQPGVLYISGLPLEKNLIAGLKRKLKTTANAFATVRGCKGRVEVHQKSSCRIELPAEAIDYAFTDPPFAGNIPYAEINFINEAWLGRYTDRADEAIVSRSQDKGLAEYQELLKASFSEVRRILKSEGKATLVFHSSSAKAWNALQAAYTQAGFAVERTGVLDKTQGSFKQVTAAGSVRGDPVILLGAGPVCSVSNSADIQRTMRQLREEAALSSDPSELTAQRLYSRLVAHYVERHQQIPLDANSFYQLQTHQARTNSTSPETTASAPT